MCTIYMYIWDYLYNWGYLWKAVQPRQPLSEYPVILRHLVFGI